MFAIIIIESKRRKVQVYLFSSTAISIDSRAVSTHSIIAKWSAREVNQNHKFFPSPSVVLREARGRSTTNYY